MATNFCDDVATVIKRALNSTDPSAYPHAKLAAWLKQFQDVMNFKTKRLSASRAGFWDDFNVPEGTAGDALRKLRKELRNIENLGPRMCHVINTYIDFGKLINNEDVGGKAMRGLSFLGRDLRPFIDRNIPLDLATGGPAASALPNGMTRRKFFAAIGSFQRMTFTVLNPNFYSVNFPHKSFSAFSNPAMAVSSEMKDKIVGAMNSFLGTVDDVVRGILDLPGSAADKEFLRDGLWRMLKSIQTPQALGGMWYQMVIMKRRGFGSIEILEGLEKGASAVRRGLDIGLDASHPIRFLECKFGSYVPGLQSIKQTVNQLKDIGASNFGAYRVLISGHGIPETRAAEAAHIARCGGRMLRYAVMNLMGPPRRRIPWDSGVRAKILNMVRDHLRSQNLPDVNPENYFKRLIDHLGKTSRPPGVTPDEWKMIKEAREFLGNSFYKIERAPEVKVEL